MSTMPQLLLLLPDCSVSTKIIGAADPDVAADGLIDTTDGQGGVFIGFQQNLGQHGSNPDLIVYTSAIKKDNPEFIAGHELGIPFLTRAQLLGQMMKNYKIPIP